MIRFTLVLSYSFGLLLAAGCGSPTPQGEKKVESGVASDHAHGAGPHGGTISDWGGGKYHVEFTVDHDKKQATVYILGDDAKTPAAVKASKLLLSINDPAFQTELMAQPLDGETAGTSSRFVGQHESLGKVQEFSGTISGEVEGTPYAADFKELPEGHGHKH